MARRSDLLAGKASSKVVLRYKILRSREDGVAARGEARGAVAGLVDGREGATASTAGVAGFRCRLVVGRQVDVAAAVGDHRDDVAAAGARFQLRDVGDGRAGEAAHAQVVVGVQGRLDALVDAVADAHAVSLEGPRRRRGAVPPGRGHRLPALVGAAAATAADADEADGVLGQRRRRVAPVDVVGADDRPRHERRRTRTGHRHRPAAHRRP